MRIVLSRRVGTHRDGSERISYNIYLEEHGQRFLCNNLEHHARGYAEDLSAMLWRAGMVVPVHEENLVS